MVADKSISLSYSVVKRQHTLHFGEPKPIAPSCDARQKHVMPYYSSLNITHDGDRDPETGLAELTILYFKSSHDDIEMSGQ